MNQSFSLPTALCLPFPDIEALIQGRIIAALPRQFLRSGQRFSLYPVDTSTNIICSYFLKEKVDFFRINLEDEIRVYEFFVNYS